MLDKENKRLNSKCKGCKYVTICGGCRAAAQNTYGDWNLEDPLCFI